MECRLTGKEVICKSCCGPCDECKAKQDCKCSDKKK